MHKIKTHSSAATEIITCFLFWHENRYVKIVTQSPSIYKYSKFLAKNLPVDLSPLLPLSSLPPVLLAYSNISHVPMFYFSFTCLDYSVFPTLFRCRMFPLTEEYLKKGERKSFWGFIELMSNLEKIFSV